jgi:hypothetical protein
MLKNPTGRPRCVDKGNSKCKGKRGSDLLSTQQTLKILCQNFTFWVPPNFALSEFDFLSINVLTLLIVVNLISYSGMFNPMKIHELKKD